MLIIAKNKISAEELSTVAIPEATKSFRPIRHSHLVDSVRGELTTQGYEILEEEHATARDGLRYFGGFAVRRLDAQADDRRLVVGLRNSSDKSISAAICMGSKMLVCENLCFGSTINLSHRHTANIMENIGEIIQSAIGQAKGYFDNMGQRIERYQNTELTRDAAPELATRLVDAGGIPARNLYPVIQEFRAPRHEEFKGNTLWNLYNAVTESLKGSDLSKLPQRTMAVQKILDEQSLVGSIELN